MPCTAPKCRHRSDLQVSVTRLRGAVVLVDHTAEHLAALHRCVQRHDDPFVMLRWPLLPGLVRAVYVVVPGVGSQDRPQVCLAIDQHPVGALGPDGLYPAFGITQPVAQSRVTGQIGESETQMRAARPWFR
jgi:hypothetical protein